jgi:cardiolipin synthase
MADLKITGLWRNAPNAISLARLLATPALLFAAVARHQGLFKWLLLACLLSDILDGLIARVFDLRSRLGAFLDSAADLLVCVITLIGLFIFKANILAAHWVPLAIVVTIYLMEIAIALWRYGRISSFHTTLVRVAAYLQGIFVMSLFLWGYIAWILYPMAVVSVLAYSEELALLFLLPDWRADVRGIYWVISKKSIATL